MRVHGCGICGSDLHYYAGVATPPAVCLGHEIAGRVATPAGGFAVGEPVVIEPLLACGSCTRCRAGEPNLCPGLRILGSLAPGGLAELIEVPVRTLYRVPADLDLDTATLAEPLAVGIHATHLGEIERGDEVLVLGGGVIGLLAAFTAATRGARVTVSARHRHQAEAARTTSSAPPAKTSSPASTPRHRTPCSRLSAAPRRRSHSPFAPSVPGGRIVALGKFTQPITLPPLRFLMKEVRLVSSMTYCRRGPRTDFETALALLTRERRRLATLITHRVPLRDVACGFALAADKSSGAIKVTVEP